MREAISGSRLFYKCSLQCGGSFTDITAREITADQVDTHTQAVEKVLPHTRITPAAIT